MNTVSPRITRTVFLFAAFTLLSTSVWANDIAVVPKANAGILFSLSVPLLVVVTVVRRRK